MVEYPKEIPLKAETTIKISFSSFNQEITFYYLDIALIYYHYQELGEIDSLLQEISKNMQFYISSDKLFINDDLINLKVNDSFLLFHNNIKYKPILKFNVINDSVFRLIDEKINEIRLEAELESVTFPISSIWYFPGPIIDVNTRQEFTISDQMVRFWSDIGSEIGGEELIIFKCKSSFEIL